MSKLIQLKISDEKLKKYNELVDLLGLKGTFGEYQRAVEFGIDYALLGIKKQAEVLPDLEGQKWALFLSSISKIKNEQEKAELIKKIQESH